MIQSTANLDMVEHVPGPLHWAVRWRRWRDGSAHGGWAGLATAAFWHAWSNGRSALRRIGIRARKDDNERWWVTWQGAHANGPARPACGDAGIEPLATPRTQATAQSCPPEQARRTAMALQRRRARTPATNATRYRSRR